MDLQKAPEEYEFSRVVLGVNSSPLLAPFVTQHHAQIHRTEYPLAAETALKSAYMEDSMDSVLELNFTGNYHNYGMELEYMLEVAFKFSSRGE